MACRSQQERDGTIPVVPKEPPLALTPQTDAAQEPPRAGHLSPEGVVRGSGAYDTERAEVVPPEPALVPPPCPSGHNPTLTNPCDHAAAGNEAISGSSRTTSPEPTDPMLGHHPSQGLPEHPLWFCGNHTEHPLPFSPSTPTALGVRPHTDSLHGVREARMVPPEPPASLTTPP